MAEENKKEFLELKILKIIPETSEAFTFILKSVDGKPVSYKAGQFLTFLITIHGNELRRSYSFSSSPVVDKEMAVTIKRQQNGEVSRYLVEKLKEGDIIKSLYPAGRFTLETNAAEKRDIFFISAGSGITPVFSLLKTILKEEPLSRITLINSNKNENTAYFNKEIESLCLNAYNLKCINIYSDPTPESKALRGRLNIPLLENLLNENFNFEKEKAEFFICGPHTFIRMARMTIIYMGIEEEKVHRESFVVEPPGKPVVDVISDHKSHRVKISYRNKEYNIETFPGQDILTGALAHGIQLPYSCRSGKCSACVSSCTKGQVKMAANEVLTEKEVSQGFILTCVGYPQTDEVEIKVG